MGSTGDSGLEKVFKTNLVQNKKRVEAVKEATKNKANIAILDDGFQSRKIERNLDIVLINGSRSDALFRLIPLGLLREPLKALSRANIIFLTKLYKPKKFVKVCKN